MKKWKIVVDSAAGWRNYPLSHEDIDFEIVPLTINVGKRLFVDDLQLDEVEFRQTLTSSKERSQSACPSPGDYMTAYQGAENVLVITITGELSGSYNSALIAKDQFLEDHPDVKIEVVDSRSTGPEMDLLADKAVQLAIEDVDMETMAKTMHQYSHESTDLLFLLESVDTLMNNGRVTKLQGRMINLLGIRLVGERSEIGTIEIVHKTRGAKRSINTLYQTMLDKGYKGGKMVIRHYDNPAVADSYIQLVRQDFPHAEITLGETRGLCSYYAEEHGVLVGFEKE